MAWGYMGFPRYVSKAEKMRKAEKARKTLQKKGMSLEPITLSGRAIAKSWWGKAWIDNLERYSDYENRLPRGRSYVRSGAVLDLRVFPGTINALVAGSRSTPYKVAVSITALGKKRLTTLQEKSRSSLDSLQLLLNGEFPADLKNNFFKQGSGLFPEPNEIKLNCSCPDWAEMCKHVAAALYGVAARLDEKPELFFLLRGIDINSFIGKAIADEGKKIAKKAAKKTARTLSLDTTQTETLFGISLETHGDKTKSVTPKIRKPPARKKTVASVKRIGSAKPKTSKTRKNSSIKGKVVKKQSATTGKTGIKKKASTVATKTPSDSRKRKTASTKRMRKDK